MTEGTGREVIKGSIHKLTWPMGHQVSEEVAICIIISFPRGLA